MSLAGAVMPGEEQARAQQSVRVPESVRFQQAWAKVRGVKRPLRPSDVAPVEQTAAVITVQVAS